MGTDVYSKLIKSYLDGIWKKIIFKRHVLGHYSDIFNYFGIIVLFAVKFNLARIALIDGITISMSFLSISQLIVGSIVKFVHKIVYMLCNTQIINNITRFLGSLY